MYVLNGQSKVAHIKPTMEQCNIDQAKERSDSDNLPSNYRVCLHCKKRIAKELLANPTATWREEKIYR